ncbi:MAG: LuxR C-terminal-related transcriptional regulator [Chloroflexota bacterium]
MLKSKPCCCPPNFFARTFRPTPLAGPACALLDQGSQQDLTLVAAPAGYGKTTLVAAWLQTVPQTPIAWLSLDEHDNDPLRFWHYLIAALHQANPAVGVQALQAVTAVSPPPLATLVNTIINDIWQTHQEAASQTILVLDDYHFMTETAVHETVNQLLDYLPPQALRLIITTRADPPLKLARRRVRQRLCEIRAADLRFTPQEIEALFQQQQTSLNQAQIAELSARTEGWAAALQLTLLNSSRTWERAALPQHSSHLVADYLLEEVLEQQPQAVQHFLLKTAVLAQFSAPLVNDLLNRNDAAATIAQVQQQNLFLIPLDAAGQWYRYHHLFADLLRAQAEKQFGPDALRQLQQKAAGWYARQQQWPQAIDLAFAAGDVELAAAHLLAYLEADPSWLFVRPEWLHQLPEPLWQANPLFYLVQAQLHFSDASGGQLQEMITLLNQARAALNALPTPQPALETHFACLRIMTVFLGNEVDRSQLLASSEDAFAAAPETAVHARGRLAYWIGLLYRRQHQPDTAAQWLTTAQALLLAANDAYVYMMAQVMRWDIEIETGEATQKTLSAIRTFKQQSALVQDSHPISGALFLMEGTVLFYRGELETAAAAFEHGLNLIQLTTEYGMELTALWNLAFVRFGLGDAAGALALAETLAERIPIFTAQTEILRHWFTLPQYGRNHTITAELDRWLGQNRPKIPEIVAAGEATNNFFQLMLLFLYVRLLLRRQESDALPTALALLQQQAELLAAPAHWRRRLQVLVHQILLLAALNRHDEALRLLAQVLTMAHKDLHRYTFIEAAEQLVPLLTQLPPGSVSAAWVQDVLAACQRYAPTTPTAGEQPLLDPLSERELEVVALLAQGLTNKEIGEQLHLSPNTVRVHTSNIYSKLGVNGRLQAADRAKSLNLLPV